MAPLSARARAVTTPPVEHPSSEDRTALETEAVVRRAMAGDPAAIESLLIRAQQTAWRFSMTVCGHQEDAEDAMQEALVKTYRHIGQLRDPAAFRPWLYRTIRNICLMARRRHAGEPAHMLSLDEPLPDPDRAPFDPASGDRSPEDVTMDAHLRRRLARALSTLPPAFRAVVFLREMEGLSTREVAAALGLSEDNVKARLHRARVALRRELDASAALPGRAAPTRPGTRAARPRRKG